MKKDNRFLKGALIGALATFLVVFVGGGIVDSLTDVGMLPALTKKAKVESKLRYLDKIIDSYYLYEDDVTEGQLTEGLYQGYMNALGDPYSTYYTEQETKALFEGLSGEFYGIGVVMSQDVTTGVLHITQVYEDSPAEKAGLLAGDILIQVDDHEISDESIDEIANWIKGDKDTEVYLKVLRNGNEVEATAIRDTVQAMTIQYEMKENQVGYIYIQEFDDVTEHQFEEALNALNEDGMKGLVIDVRSNPGGNLDTVVNMLKMILPKGEIVSIRNRAGEQEQHVNEEDHTFDKPLVVLVDQYSASAAEIFSGAIQDYEVGKIVGVTTFGKGIVQDIMDLGDGTSMKLTTAEYFLPSGRSIHKKGITPDVEVEFVYDESNPLHDNQLEKALEIVEEEINS